MSPWDGATAQREGGILPCALSSLCFYFYYHKTTTPH